MEYIRKYENNNIHKIFLVVTKQCNLSCSFCVRECDSTQEINIDTKKILSYLDEIKVLYPNTKIIITGGEALLHPHIDKILSKAISLFNNKVVLCSNGTNITTFKKNIFLLRQCTLQISIDGNEYYHDKLRGRGTYKKTQSTIQYLLDQNIKTIVASTISVDNVNSIKEKLTDMMSIGVINFKLSQEMPSGFAKIRKDKHLSFEEWNMFCDDIYEFIASFTDSNIHLSMRKSFPFIGKRLNMNNVSDKMLCLAGCKAGITQLYIYPNLMVYGCPMLIEHPIANLRKCNLKDIDKTSNDSRLYEYKLNNTSTCYSCKYLAICRGGCPGRSINMYDMWSGDFLCPEIKGKINNDKNIDI